MLCVLETFLSQIFSSAKKYKIKPVEMFWFCARLITVSAGKNILRGQKLSLRFQNVLPKALLFHYNISVPPQFCLKWEMKTEHHILYE